MASDFTPLRKRPYPAESDNPDVAADVKGLALSLDSAPTVGVGQLSQRPTTGMAAGDRYYVENDLTLTNNGIEWLYDGAQWVQAAQDSPVGSGDIWFGPQDPADTHWLICDGRALDRVQYAALYAVIGTTYGDGNGTSTFNIPDLRQRVPLGVKPSGAAGSSSAIGEKGGQIDHTHPIPGLTVPSLSIPSLNVSVYVPAHSHPLSANGGAAFHSGQYGNGLVVWSSESGPSEFFSGAWLYNGSNPPSWVTGFQGSFQTAALIGNTDNNGGFLSGGSTTASGTGGGVTGTGTSGSQNPPYLSVNFIIRVK